ncbi:hypothetical protein N7528_009724 [Penicillium herquei]|nr:hypothetical protein N7528_009724 [Penicillium herquei]
MAPQSPIGILIIHGAYFLPAAYESFSNRLTEAGLAVRCPRLPSCGDTIPPTALLEHDINAVQEAAKELIATNRKIIVLAHSYGGIVASAAITSDLYSVNGSSGVVSLIYLAAWLLVPGQGLDDVIAKHGMQSKVDLGTHGDGVMFPKNAADSFFNDLDRAEAEELAKGNVTHNWMAATGKMTHAPWMDLPMIYVFCSQDLALLPPLQQAMLQGAVDFGDGTDGGAGIVTETIDSGHCPFLSKPEEVQRVIEMAAANIR